MKVFVLALTLAFAGATGVLADDWELVWSDEFDKDGMPDTAVWNFERGFVRNEEDQWYQSDNAYVKDGMLVIEGRKERVKNPRYVKDSRRLAGSTVSMPSTRRPRSTRLASANSCMAGSR